MNKQKCGTMPAGIGIRVMTAELKLTPKGKQLLDHWRSLPLRDGEQLPYWQDVSANALLPIMDRAWVLEHVAPDQMIVKYMGSRVVTFAGQDTTGKDFVRTRIAPENRPYMLALYRLVYDTQCGACLTRLLRRSGQNNKIMTTTFFPLHSSVEGSWILLGMSEIASTSSIPDTAGQADFFSSHLREPYFVDLGFGTPSESAVAERLTPLRA